MDPALVDAAMYDNLLPLVLGVVIGLLLAVPAAIVWTRRAARRVRHFEQRAQAAERLAELGTLTGGLAHEIKNPLSTVGLNVQLLKEDLSEISQQVGDEPQLNERVGRMQRRFDALRRETQRLRDILEDFLEFAGRVELDLQDVDLNALLDELADFYEPQARAAQVRLRTQLDARPAYVRADPALLKQALLNLLINATQAMVEAREKNQPHGGANELLLRTERQRSPLGEDMIVLHAIDTGPGISEANLARVFQPYFSTKRGGSGLGLPTARRIVEEHAGQLSVHTEPGRGTDFTISLCAIDEPDG